MSSIDRDAGRLGESSGAVLARWLARFALPIVIVLMEIGFSLAEPAVLSSRNLLNVLEHASYLVILATGQLIVILTRGFDLSLGMCVSAVSVLAALVMTGIVGGGDGGLVLGIGLGILAGLGVGLGVGLFNGVVVAYWRVNPFAATLGSLYICYCIASTSSGGTPVFNVPDEFSQLFYSGTVLHVPATVIIAVVVCVAVWLLLERTVFGRSLYIIGSNPRAARLAGLPNLRFLALAYVACSLLAAIGALVLTARTGSGEPNLGGSLMLESIAAAVIGGVSLEGGVGGVMSAVLGSIFVTILDNSMDLLQVSGYIQQILLGCVIIIAIFLDRLRTRRA